MRLFSSAVFCCFMAVSGLVVTNCSKNATDTTSNLTISGIVAASRDARDIADIEDGEDDSRVSCTPSSGATSFTMRCVTLSGTIAASESAVDTSTCSFSLTLPISDGTPFGCFVMNGSSLVATVAFTSTTTGMDGGTTSEGSYVAGGGGSLEFGTVNLSVASGTATVVKTEVTGTATTASGSSSSGSFTDMTGTWAVSNCKNLTTGETCASDFRGSGPPSSLYLHQMGPATDGSGGTHYGLAVWKSALAYQNCGSKEGVTLPSGWTTSDSTLGGGSFTFDSFDNDFSDYSARDFGGGKTTCNFTYTSGLKCDAISANTGNWGNGTVTFSADDCKAMCAANAVHEIESGTCPARWNTDWSKVNAATATGQISTCTSAGCGTGAAASYITRSTRPQNRFVSNEMVITGSTGTVYDDNSETQYACVKASASTQNCTQISCTVTEHVVVQINQTSSTTAMIGVTITNTANGIGGTTTSQCTDTTLVDNHIASRVSKAEAFVFTATKQ